MDWNWKAVLRKPLWDMRSRKCKRLIKKMSKDPDRFSLQWRNDIVSKYASKMLDGFNLNVKVIGKDNLSNVGPALLVGNHQDYSDAFIVLQSLRKTTKEKDEQNKIATFLAKDTLKHDNLIRYPLELMDVFFLERDNWRKSLEIYKDFGKFIKKNKTYGIIFPEGTRNQEKIISDFKPGAFKIAQKELIPIIPFTINNSVRGIDWRRKTKLNTEIIFHKKIPASSFINQSTQALAERVQKIVESSFVPPVFLQREKSEKTKAKRIKKKKIYNKKENNKANKAQKEKEKILKQELRLKTQEEEETKKFIEVENKKKTKKESKKKT